MSGIVVVGLVGCFLFSNGRRRSPGTKIVTVKKVKPGYQEFFEAATLRGNNFFIEGRPPTLI